MSVHFFVSFLKRQFQVFTHGYWNCIFGGVLKMMVYYRLFLSQFWYYWLFGRQPLVRWNVFWYKCLQFQQYFSFFYVFNLTISLRVWLKYSRILLSSLNTQFIWCIITKIKIVSTLTFFVNMILKLINFEE